MLVVSALEEPDLVDRCLSAGAAGFLTKRTADHDAVLGAILAVARGERVLPVDSYAQLLAHRPPAQEFRNPMGLTAREMEVLTLVAEGDDNLKISAMLGITERTVRAHVSALYRKVAVENRAQLALRGLQLRPRGGRPAAAPTAAPAAPVTAPAAPPNGTPRWL
jgi:DNA-binding NarL/FixJ family response regulator